MVIRIILGDGRVWCRCGRPPFVYKASRPNGAGLSHRKECDVRKVVVTNNVTLDGVMQAPARADEDRRGGFDRGGWAVGYEDPVMGQVMGERMARPGALLLGRRTYEDFAAVWPGRTDNPFTERLDHSQKYVASTSTSTCSSSSR
jgi:hypothetical protein